MLHWLEAEKLLSIIFRDQKELLASDIYATSSLLHNQSIINDEFSDKLNEYLDYIDDRYEIGSEEYISFYNQKLYPFLIRQMGELVHYKLLEKLNVFISRVKVGHKEVIVRESYLQGKWFIYSGKNNLSFAQYRIAESSPVDLRLIFPILRDYAKVKRLDEEFGPDKINDVACSLSEWSDIKCFIEAASYYGFKVDNLQIDALKGYAVCKEYDRKDNPFREAGIVKVIPAKDIEELTEYYDNVDSVVSILKKMGLKSGSKIGTCRGNIVDLYPDSIALINSDDENIIIPFIKKVYDMVLQKEKKIMLSYENIERSSVNIKLELLRQSKMIVTEAYAGICEAILEDELFWNESSDVLSEVIVRARVGAKKNTIIDKKKKVPISLQYVLEHKLGETVRKALEDRHFDQIRLINNEYFREIPSDEVLPIIGILAPEKLDTRMKAGEVHYFCGDLSSMPSNHRYLLDGSGKAIFLHRDDNGNYKDALAKYLNTSFDPEALTVIADLEEQNRYVKEKWIIPALEESGHNYKEAFQILKMYFHSMSPKEYVQILSWFRFQSYSEEAGNAALNNEKEIESDYREQPWHFVYEFLQNIDDCKYPANILSPELNIKIDETANNISFSYNEVGFSESDIDAITKFGNSDKAGVLETDIPKTGVFDLEKTGRMGRGFKSVFALPGKGIVVHIQSNGYSFKFLKRLGQIIPVWEDVEEMPNQGTKIIIEGFAKDTLSQIYSKLREMFSVDQLDNFFAICPILYLRKLKKISIAKENDKFSIDIQKENQRYSEEHLDVKNRRIVSGIRYDNQFCESVWDNLYIQIENGTEHPISLKAIRYTRMLLTEVETRIISITAPILTESSTQSFRCGSLFRTLPLDKNKFRLPFAINAPFKTDDGRNQVRDQKRAQKLMGVLFDEVLPCFYRYIRTIKNIDINNYIAPYNDTLFDGYQNINRINLGEYTRKRPILKLYGQDNYVAYRNAKILPGECYCWPEPTMLIQIFCPDAEGEVVDERYTNSQLKISQINLIDSEFVDHINEYLDYVENQFPSKFWNLVDKDIIPMITEKYSDLRKSYFSEKTVDELEKLKVFGFYSYDGSVIREAADAPTVWLCDCPEQYAAYGNYRSMNKAPIHYTDVCNKWMGELHEFVSYSDAFSKELLVSSEIDCWSKAKQLIETILYYHVPIKFKVPYLKKCVLSELYDSKMNIFRDAYLELNNNNIISHYIDEDDIIEIWITVGDVSDVEPEDIIKLIYQLGIRSGNDFFKYSQDSIRCNEETLQLLKEYCTTEEKSTHVLRLIFGELENLRDSKGNERRFIIDYKSVAECSAVLLSCLICSSLMEETDTKILAEKLYNDNNKYGVSNEDLKEAFLHCALILPSEKMNTTRRISMKLSEIISRKLGMCIQKVMAVHEKDLEFNIELDVPCGEYSGERISKALSWLSDSDENQNIISKTYNYYTAKLDQAFEDTVPKKQMYICDREKVILSCEAEDGSLLAFVRAHYQGKDNDFSTLIDIIARQEELKSWHSSKKEYVNKLATFRRITGKITSILYPRMIENINNANSNPLEYIVPELLQNINDCLFTNDEHIRNLNIEIDTKQGLMRLTYDEIGFDFSNVYSITALGKSSKHDESEGEKGLGFKKVFVLFDFVEIYSNGFSFAISSKEPTVPSWISVVNKQNQYPNGTCMVFHTKEKSKLKKVADLWKGLFIAPYVGRVASPLFLENIHSYRLIIDDNEKYDITRDEIIKGYYVIKRNLMDAYESAISASFDTPELEEHRKLIRSDIKKRKKCEVMSDKEFDDYINGLTISICVPLDLTNKVEGVFFSTLPTTDKTRLSMFINLPFELNTGRDEIQKDLPYNRRIMNMVFSCPKNSLSVFGRILQQIALELPEKEVFEYIKEDIAGWLDFISVDDDDKLLHREELERLSLFHAYPDNELVSINQSYSLDRVIYQYMRTSDDIKHEIMQWLHKNIRSSQAYRMLAIRKAPATTCESLEKFVKDIGFMERRYPLVDDMKDIVVEYFRDEYGAVEVEEDEK